MGQPQRIGELLAKLLAQRGYGQAQTTQDLNEAWRAVAGEALAAQTRAGTIKRGTLEVLVAHSLLLQELTFQQADLLTKLQKLLPERKLKQLRFRVGVVRD